MHCLSASSIVIYSYLGSWRPNTQLQFLDTQCEWSVCVLRTIADRVSKTSHLWFAISLTHVNGFWYFCRNVTDKVSNQKVLYCVTSNNLCFCATWQYGETRKLDFHSNAVLVHCLNSTSCLISSVFLTHDSYSRCCMTF